VVSFPALMTGDAAYVRIVSCNPLEVRGDDIPPVFSGYPMDDRSQWADFLAEFDRVHADTWAEWDAWCREQGAPPLPPREFMHASPDCNVYVFPEELDYLDARPLDRTWHRIDSSVRETDEDYLLPRELADSMTGAEFLPQTRILPEVDLVVTHGGNNTVTESFFFGKPMVVLPLFWDQYDNAQRVHELGYGVRLHTYGHEPDELRGAIDLLLADEMLRQRLSRISARLQADPGTTRAAGLIERVAETSERLA
jgi:hypothetical protein